MATAAELYDRVTYPSLANADTHPARLGAMAMLHGLSPAAPDACRVLEIGCNSGANIIPMAYALPGSDFTGFDIAGAPIAVGQERVEALGVRNVRLLQADLMEAAQYPELAGKFDYIIAHGVYAWVPEPVRDRLLAFCNEHLAEHGVAFISYAALPGCHMRLMTREIMTGRRKEPHETGADLRESIRFLEFVAKSRPQGDGFRMLLERELHGMERRAPEQVFHDEMATFYRPVYFQEFAGHAESHGLRYFSEASFPKAGDPTYQQAVVTEVREWAPGDLLAQEQVLDFARMRMYRESLLCRAGAPFQLDLQPDALRRLYFTTRARQSEADTAGARAYSLPNKVAIETQSLATIAVLDQLITALPEPMSFAELFAGVRARLPLEEQELLMLLGRLVITCFVEADAWKPPFRRDVAERPFASKVAREAALRQNQVFTLLLTALSVEDPVVRQLLLLLDGTRERAELTRALAEVFPEAPAEGLAAGLEDALQMFNQAGLLETR